MPPLISFAKSRGGGGGGGGIGPPLSFEEKFSYYKEKINSKIDLKNFAKLTKCMVMHLVNFCSALTIYYIKSFKIAEEERLAIYKNLTVYSVTS